jgi:NADPH2:quinone reductase
MSPFPETMTTIVTVPPVNTTDRGPQILSPETRPVPDPGDHEILVKVAAAGVNRVDVMQRQGLYAPPPGASEILGVEVAGEVVALGPLTSRFKVGDDVCCLMTGGGYAEYAVAHESSALPVPEGLTLVEAGATPQTFFTAWLNVFELGALKAGETVLIHGGTSGVGTTAIMLAKAFGARVIATAGSDVKVAACRSIGADVALNYHTQEFVAETLKATEGRGPELIVDMVAGDYLERNCEAAAWGGRIVQIAVIEAPIAPIDLRVVMRKQLTLTGSMLRPRSIAQKAAIAEALKTKVWPLLAQGRCKPVIDSTFPLLEAARAHVRIETGAHVGKIVLTT